MINAHFNFEDNRYDIEWFSEQTHDKEITEQIVALMWGWA
jgi:hypothetical protein